MLSQIAPIGSLLGGVALLLLGNGLLNTLLTLRGVAEGYSTGLLGLLMSGYFVGYLLGTWLTVPLIRRIGHIRAFACC
ncbi:MFS transporter, partial [Azotobacter chroococcum]|nr:MFS transporter [Azotobacter chroococcum]